MAFSRLHPPESLAEALQPVVALNATDLTKLSSALSGPNSFSLTDKQVMDLANTISIDEESLPYVLSALSALYDYVKDRVSLGKEFDAVINDIAIDFDSDKFIGSKSDKLASAMRELLKPQSMHTRRRKISRLQKGNLPTALGFTSFVDLRPDFDDSRSELVITGYVPVVQLRITTDAFDPSFRRLTLQLTKEGLDELSKTLERTISKITALKTQSSLATMLIDE